MYYVLGVLFVVFGMIACSAFGQLPPTAQAFILAVVGLLVCGTVGKNISDREKE